MSIHVPLSVLVPSKNEAGNIEPCLQSADFADEIVVVDSGSTDGTQEIAERMGARVVDFNWNRHFPKKKNWALDTIPWANEWVFVLDADERFTPELIASIRKALKYPTCDGYYINRRFWFMGGWLRHCGYYPSWNLRMFRHRMGRYEQFEGLEDTGSGDNEVHEHVILQGRAEKLSGELDHYAYPSIEVWLEKHNRYSNWEACAVHADSWHESDGDGSLHPHHAAKRRLKKAAHKMPFRPLLRFLYHYVFRLGFLDGYRGYIFCRLMGIYEFLSLAKSKELKRAPAVRVRAPSVPIHASAAIRQR